MWDRWDPKVSIPALGVEGYSRLRRCISDNPESPNFGQYVPMIVDSKLGPLFEKPVYCKYSPNGESNHPCYSCRLKAPERIYGIWRERFLDILYGNRKDPALLPFPEE